MSFESGTIGVRFFHIPHKLTEESVADFAEHVAPPYDTAQEEPVFGWVTGRHMLDRDITVDNAVYGGYLRMQLLEISRKIPASLLQAEVKLEEFVRKAVSGTSFLNRKERSLVKQEVRDRLLPDMPPQLKAIPFVSRLDDQSLMATAMNDKAVDLLTAHIRHATGTVPIALDPDVLALEKHRVDALAWPPCSYSKDIAAEAVVNHPGVDFMTWLWYYAESKEGTIDLPTLGRIGLVLEGPLTFVMEGAGAQEVVLKKGNPPISREAQSCLLSGKKLSKAKLNVVLGDDIWSFNLDAETFIFRGVKLPDPEDMLDPLSSFQDRMSKVESLRDIMFELFGVFVDERRDIHRWGATVKKMRAWVVERKTLA